MVKAEQQLVWMAFHDGGEVHLLYPREPAYLARFSMLGPRGEVVRKTPLGKQFGSTFDLLPTNATAQVGLASAWGSFAENPGLGGGRLLPAPKDLFVMKDDGPYTMRVEIQMYLHLPATNTLPPVRFPPVTLRVDRMRDD